MKVLVIGQTPPPYHGQSMMTQRLVNAQLKDIQIFHVRMSFSDSIQSIGKLGVGKILHMFSIVAQVIQQRFKHHIKVLYYMPAGPNLAPLIRDIFMLMIIRRFYPKVIFHFRAAGISDFVQQLPAPLRWLARLAYRNPELSIYLSGRNPDDGGYFNTKKKIVVPNGLEDAATPYLPIHRPEKETVNILFVGVVNESKGVMVLLQAMARLHAAHKPVKLTLMGDFATEAFKETAFSYCAAQGITAHVDFAGVKQGEEKWHYFLNADIFCFASFYESESFGNVAVEAMMFQLPVVATRWRGIPDIVEDGTTGLLVPIKDADKTAEALTKFIDSYELRQKMGKAGREKYASTFQFDNFLNNMQQAFHQV